MLWSTAAAHGRAQGRGVRRGARKKVARVLSLYLSMDLLRQREGVPGSCERGTLRGEGLHCCHTELLYLSVSLKRMSADGTWSALHS